MTAGRAEPELQVSCPRCGVGQGERCIARHRDDGTTGAAAYSHRLRYYAAVKAGFIALRGAGWIPPEWRPEGVSPELPPAAERFAAAERLLEEALHLRMYGERAPGGNETWREWDRKAEGFLRSRLGEPGSDIAATQGSESSP